MKVGVLLPNVPPTVGGGFAFQDDVFQALLRLEGKHTFVIFGYLTEAQAREASTKHLQFFSFPRSFPGRAIFYLARTVASGVADLPIIGNRLRVTNRFQRAIRDLGIEVMWFVGPSYIEVDIPYIFTVWDLQHRLQPWFPEVSANGEWRRREKMYATAIPRASAVIVGTEAGRAEVVQFYGVPPEHVKLIPHPTPGFALRDPKNKSEEVLTKYRIPKGYLFYPAQFWPHKNHVGLLLAVKILREQHGLTLPAVFVGSDMGNLLYVRHVVEELRLSNQVYFLGFLPQEDLVGLYRNAFALTYLTFFGPENLPPLEAFALGCPVIASNVSGAEEQLGDAALLVDPRNEEQIALAVRSLYDDLELRRTLVQRGFERASRWTGQDFVKSVFSILDEFEPVRRSWGR